MGIVLTQMRSRAYNPHMDACLCDRLSSTKKGRGHCVSVISQVDRIQIRYSMSCFQERRHKCICIYRYRYI